MPQVMALKRNCARQHVDDVSHNSGKHILPGSPPHKLVRAFMGEHPKPVAEYRPKHQRNQYENDPRGVTERDCQAKLAAHRDHDQYESEGISAHELPNFGRRLKNSLSAFPVRIERVDVAEAVFLGHGRHYAAGFRERARSILRTRSA